MVSVSGSYSIGEWDSWCLRVVFYSVLVWELWCLGWELRCIRVGVTLLCVTMSSCLGRPRRG